MPGDEEFGNGNGEVEDPPVENRSKGELPRRIGSFLVFVLLFVVREVSIPELKDGEIAYA